MNTKAMREWVLSNLALTISQNINDNILQLFITFIVMCTTSLVKEAMFSVMLVCL